MKWISVKDRLPEYLNDVFICNAHHNPTFNYYTVGFYIPYSSRWGVSTEMLRIIKYDENLTIELDREVTHWMPLPEPPEELKE